LDCIQIDENFLPAMFLNQLTVCGKKCHEPMIEISGCYKKCAENALRRGKQPFLLRLKN